MKIRIPNTGAHVLDELFCVQGQSSSQGDMKYTENTELWNAQCTYIHMITS